MCFAVFIAASSKAVFGCAKATEEKRSNSEDSSAFFKFINCFYLAIEKFYNENRFVHYNFFAAHHIGEVF